MSDGPIQKYRAMLAGRQLTHDPAQERAVEMLQLLHMKLQSYRPQYTSGFLSRLFSGSGGEPIKGIYICGDVGRGKSMLMDLFYQDAPVEHKRRVHFHEFMLEIHAGIKAWREKPDTDKRRSLKDLDLPSGTPDDPIPPVAKGVADRSWLLCFDEFQVTDVADAMILGRLFQSLFEFGVVVVATSNRNPKDLYKDGLNRQLFLPFIDLICERMEVHHLDALRDYRLERLQGGDVYFTPLGPGATAQMDAAWRRLTDMDRGEPCTLEVQGRVLQVPMAAKGVARFTFEDLCAKPLGAADYLSIARHFHTVLLDGIPALGPEKRNEAKRFVTLIDAFYENSVKLIASAAVPPDKLYPAGDGSFEFARTVSRLMEMQSKDYLAKGHAV